MADFVGRGDDSHDATLERAYAELQRRFLLNLQAIAPRITAIPHSC
jgi:hypothetical protein